MKSKSNRLGWAGASLLAGAAALLMFAAPVPANADISRSCVGTINLYVQDGNRVSYDFHIPVTVSSRAMANRARERSRQAMIDCLEAHWETRMSDLPPHWCNEGGDYPFENLNRDIGDAVCAANPGRQSLVVDLNLVVDGRDRCMVNNLWAGYDIASDHRVYCWLEADDTLDGADPDSAQPSIGDAGSWECVGDGCADAGTASGPGMPGIRLPGNDIGGDWIGLDGTWQQCVTMCERTPGCNAWTWRGPGTTPGSEEAGCLLKSGVGARVSDPCCHSGVME